MCSLGHSLPLRASLHGFLLGLLAGVNGVAQGMGMEHGVEARYSSE